MGSLLLKLCQSNFNLRLQDCYLLLGYLIATVLGNINSVPIAFWENPHVNVKKVDGSRSGNLGLIKANDPGFIFLLPKVLPTYYYHLNQSFVYVLPYSYFFSFLKSVYTTRIQYMCNAFATPSGWICRLHSVKLAFQNVFSKVIYYYRRSLVLLEGWKSKVQFLSFSFILRF